jgi:hypothetical protein
MAATVSGVIVLAPAFANHFDNFASQGMRVTPGAWPTE